MRSAIISFPGSNRERDLERALTAVLGHAPVRVWHQDTELPSVDLVCLPGGFAYGDYLRAGAMAAHSPVMREVKRKAELGFLVLGICNGFQILTEAGLLPGALVRNRELGFVCRKVELEVVTTASPFTKACTAGQRLRVPVAHHDGNYTIDQDGLKRLEGEDRVAFRYVGNPNGSLADIAGVLNAGRNVLGLMPHPENAAEPLHDSCDGLAVFRSLLEAA